LLTNLLTNVLARGNKCQLQSNTKRKHKFTETKVSTTKL